MITDYYHTSQTIIPRHWNQILALRSDQEEFGIEGDESVPMTKLGNETNEWNCRYMIMGEYLDLEVTCEAPASSIMPTSREYQRAVQWINNHRVALAA